MSVQALTFVIEHCEATRGARCMMFAIANHANERGEDCWASVRTLAHEARLTRTGAQDAIRKLVTDGEIEQTGVSPFNTKIYRIRGLTKGGQETWPPGQENTSRGPSSQGQGGQATGPKPSKEPSIEPTPPVSPPRKRGGRARSRRSRESDEPTEFVL